MKPRIKARAHAFDIDAFPLDQSVCFRLKVPGSDDPELAHEVAVPVAICYRLFYLGRAYDGQVIKNFRPDGAFQVSFQEIQLLISELEFVEAVVNDPVVKHYVPKLVQLLKLSSSRPNSILFGVARTHAAQQPHAAIREL